MNRVKPDLKGWLDLQDKEDSQYALSREIEKVWREVIKQEEKKGIHSKIEARTILLWPERILGQFMCYNLHLYFSLNIKNRWLTIWVEVYGKAAWTSDSLKLCHRLHTNLTVPGSPFVDLSMWLFLFTSWQRSCLWRLPSPYQAQEPVWELVFQSFGCLLLFQ